MRQMRDLSAAMLHSESAEFRDAEYSLAYKDKSRAEPLGLGLSQQEEQTIENYVFNNMILIMNISAAEHRHFSGTVPIVCVG